MRVRTDVEDVDHPNEPRDLRGAVAPAVGFSSAERPLYGLLHAHTFFSDGSGAPKDAFAFAKQQGLQFLAVTEHNHDQAELGASDRTDGVMIAKLPALYNSTQKVTVTRRPRDQPPQTLQVDSLLSAASNATTATFAPLYGQEFSTISSGNHMNVIRWNEVLRVEKGEFKNLYELLDHGVQSGAATPLLQMNHPNVSSDLFSAAADFNDYGLDDYGGSFSDLVAASDKYVAVIEVLSGPATTPKVHAAYHYSDTGESDYLFYLSQGFHLSPSVGQDNHYQTWGKTTPARMGVYATATSPDAVIDAIRANKTFATEDKNLRVQFRINGKPMGSVLDVPAGTGLKFSVTVADTDEPDAEYTATLVHGFVEPQTTGDLRRIALRDAELDSYTLTESTVELDELTSTGDPEFFYLRIVQDHGDRAWTAPIWIRHPRNR